MKALMILGSRNPEGQTARAARALLQGIAGKGGQYEEFFLPKMSIERCRQCEDSGWGICRTEGRCVIEDDLASLVEKIKGADAVIFATPVYFSDLSESIRAFLKSGGIEVRMVRTIEPTLEDLFVTLTRFHENRLREEGKA